MTETKDEKTEKKGKGCLGWIWRVSLVGFVVLVVLLMWVNGPGMRWLGPKAAVHFLEKAGMEGGLRLGGTLLGGVEVYDLEISSKEGALERLVVDRLETDYRFTEVIKGKVRGISGEGIHADIRLVETPKEEKPPTDFAKLGKTLSGVREKVLPLVLDLQDVSVSVTKEGERVVALEGSDFSHKAGADLISLELGRVIAPDGKFTQKQEVSILWDAEGLTLDKLELLPMAGIREVVVKLPEDGAIAASAELRLGDGNFRLDVGAGIKDVRLDLVEGELDLGKLLGGFGLGLPIEGRLTSLAVGVEQVFPEWQTAVGSAEVFVEDFSWDGWDVPEAALGVRLGEGEYGLKLAGRALGSGVEIDGSGKFERAVLETDGFVTEGIAGKLKIAELGAVLKALDGKLDMGGRFAHFPKSEIAGDWSVALDSGMFSAAGLDVTLKSRETEASLIRLNASYEGQLLKVKSLEAEGLALTGEYDLETKSYEAEQSMEDFKTAAILPWLNGAGVELPGSAVVAMKWKGSGNLFNNTHSGRVEGLAASWEWNQAEDGDLRAPISASGEASYEWPGVVELDGFLVETEGQKVALDARLAENELDLENFVWSEGDEELARGWGKLPVPEDFSKFKEFVANDTRALDLNISSEVLPLSRLKPWVKGIEKIDEKATGKIDFKVAGSLAEPEVDVSVEIRDVSVPGQEDIPTTDVTVKMEARDGLAKISAQAVAADYAPAVLKAEMPFLPKKWAEDPASLQGEEISGVLDLPKIELSRFQALVPGAEELSGLTTGKVVIGGTVGDPVVDGDLKLSGGKFRMKGDAVPALDGIDLEVKSDLKTVTLTGGVRDVAGGNVTISGKMDLRNGEGTAPGEVNLSIKGNAVPVLRNDFLLMRANIDLSVKGTMEDALVSGEVGLIDSIFYKDMELIPIGAPFLEPSAASLPKVDTPQNIGAAVPAPFSGWNANITVKTIDPILIRGNLGTGQVSVGLRIEGKLGDPKPNGKVRISNVVARLPLSTLRIREGYLTFTPATGFDPALEIRGTSEPRPYRVQVYVYGRMSDPQLVLTSEPPLPENEIMTLLATGTTSSGLEDSQAASSRAMQLLIEEMRRGRFLFGKQLRPVLGLLDEVDFSLAESDPYDSDSYTSATLKISNKWFVSAGLGEKGDQRILAIWRLRFR